MSVQSSQGPPGGRFERETTNGAGGDPGRRRSSVYDRVRTPREMRSIKRLPALIRDALRVVWRAAPRELGVLMVIQLAGGLGLAAQLLVGREALAAIIEAERAGGGLAAILPQLAALAGVTAFVGIAISVQQDRALLLSELVARQAQGAVLDVACAVDLEVFDTPSFHDRLARARYNAGARPIVTVNSLLAALNAGFGATGVTVALFAIQPLLVPPALLAMFPLWLATSRNSKAYYDFAVSLTPHDRERTYVHSLLSEKEPAAEIRAFGAAGFLRRRHDDLYDERIAALRRLVRARTRRSLAAGTLSVVLTGGLMTLLVLLLLDGRLTLAATGTALGALIILGQRLRALVTSLGLLYESSLFIEDVASFLDHKPTLRTSRPTRPAPTGFERLAVESVSFAYPGSDRPALRQVSLELRRGDVVALVGANGSGKTTLAKILAGLYLPQSGQVLWDGVPVAECDPGALRRSIAVIFQDFGHYGLSARDNIGMGRLERIDDVDGIVEAARTAGADQFLTSLPGGYSTVLSGMFEGGTDLSIGQWQRVALARAFFRNAPFFIMDEPTAAVDPLTEYELFRRLGTLCRGRSVLLISHRFSSVRSADRIYVMHEGAVVEHGSHDELMAQDGRYAALYRVQAASYLTKALGSAGDD